MKFVPDTGEWAVEASGFNWQSKQVAAYVLSGSPVRCRGPNGEIGLAVPNNYVEKNAITFADYEARRMAAKAAESVAKNQARVEEIERLEKRLEKERETRKELEKQKIARQAEFERKLDEEKRVAQKKYMEEQKAQEIVRKKSNILDDAAAMAHNVEIDI